MSSNPLGVPTPFFPLYGTRFPAPVQLHTDRLPRSGGSGKHPKSCADGHKARAVSVVGLKAQASTSSPGSAMSSSCLAAATRGKSWGSQLQEYRSQGQKDSRVCVEKHNTLCSRADSDPLY